MNTTAIITAPPPSPETRRKARTGRPLVPERPTFAEMLDETLPLIGFVAVAAQPSSSWRPLGCSSRSWSLARPYGCLRP
jgi:hypothetical protein